MSAEVLREAARLMRHHAQACVDVPWYTPSEITGPTFAESDRHHIACWTPAVALAVADLLDMEADWADQGRENSYALDIARAHLGERVAGK